MRITFFLPAQDEWITQAIKTVQANQHDGCRPSQGEVIRAVLAKALAQYKPPDPLELEHQQKLASGFYDNDLVTELTR